MKTYNQFRDHLLNQDDGDKLVDDLEKHTAKLIEDLETTKQVKAAGYVFTDQDWIDEFLSEAAESPVVYRYLAQLAKEPSGLLPAITVGQVLNDYREYWIKELAAADAQHDHGDE